MTLREFLDAAYTLLIRNAMSRGATLFEAMDGKAEFAAVTLHDDSSVNTAEAQARKERAEMEREEQGMAAINAALARAGKPGLI